MPNRHHLTDSECLALVHDVSTLLSSGTTESAVGNIVALFRETFGVSAVCVREIISRPCSLRFTYEATDGSLPQHINETLTFAEDEWKLALQRLRGSYCTFRKDSSLHLPELYAEESHQPLCMIQIPMFSRSDFLGLLELIDNANLYDWTECEIKTLDSCANLMCQYLRRLNITFLGMHGGDDVDPLTGLMTFHSFTEKLDERFAEMLSDAPICVVYTDIHHFKYINETYGYKKGDELLKRTAQAFLDGAKDDILLCRVYADHFVTAGAVPEEMLPTFETFIHQQNEKLAKMLQEHCPDIRVRVTTGFCYVRDSSMTAATAIANANLARKVAARDNLRRPLLFTESMMEEIKYQEYLTNKLPKAIANHDLKVYYQPKINCADDSLYGAEALVRWQKPDGTFIYPDQFIPVFEKNGSIMDVDFYVYREVFQYIRRRLDEGLPVFPISMNVSRVHFRADRIIPYIESLLAEYQMPPELVEFELTENIYMKNFGKADAFIKACRAHGIQVSMDDFGSGYSSLNVISALHIDTLKIDKIFLKNDQLSDSDKTVIESMISMAKRLGMKVICEGVETEAQTFFLKGVKCDQIQGYYYGKPMDVESFHQFAAKKMAELSMHE